MMGTSHAVTGAAAWIAVTSTSVPAFGWMPLEGVGVVAGALVAAGAALLPDADHHSGTIAFAVPGGSVVTSAIGAATGGHRKGTHSLLAMAAVTIAAYLLSFIVVTPNGWPHGLQLGSAVVIAACTCFGVKALKLTRSWPKAWLTGAAAAAAIIWFVPEQTWWLPVCIGVGYLAHLLGDALTVQGVPFLWPWMPERPGAEGTWWFPRAGSWALPILGNAGSWREWLFVLPVTLYVLWGLVMDGLDAARGLEGLAATMQTWLARAPV